MSDVSPTQGHESLAKPSVKAAQAHSYHSPILYSQFQGPFPMNMAETDEERKKREEDEAKQSNFKKVQMAREEAEALAKAEKARADEAERKLRDREAADKKAADEKLLQDKKFEELAAQREAEAKAKSDEAAAEKKRADDLQAKVKAFEDQQEAELAEIVKAIPADKMPPLDSTDPVAKRLQQAKYALSLISTSKPQIGAGVRPDKSSNARKDELLKKGLNRLSSEETLELMEMSEA